MTNLHIGKPEKNTTIISVDKASKSNQCDGIMTVIYYWNKKNEEFAISSINTIAIFKIKKLK